MWEVKIEGGERQKGARERNFRREGGKGGGKTERKSKEGGKGGGKTERKSKGRRGGKWEDRKEE